MTKVTYTPRQRYKNPRAQELGLNQDDIKREAKIARLLEDLASKKARVVQGQINWHFQEADGTGALSLPQDWQNWPELTPRTVWGTTQKHTWIVAEITVPPAAAGKVFAIKITSGWRSMQGSTDPQCLAYLDGKIAQAIDGNHDELVISQNAVAGERHFVQINAFTYDERPMIGFQTDLMVNDRRIEALHIDLATAFDVVVHLPQTDGRRHAVLDHVERALHVLDRRAGQDDRLTDDLPRAEAIVSKINNLTDTDLRPKVTAFGHTHLDVAWLWRVKHVRDKAARSFATALNLMDEFPDFVFMYNQSVLFHFLKQDYPELWARVKEKVRTGQFEIDGAMGVEPDVNISSGESLVRQIMRGQQFHQDEFGITPKCVWLPDTFGYSAALPQILNQSGIGFFVTSKLSWNDTDRQPYDSFFWRGIDGTKIKSQLITTQAAEADYQQTFYNSALSVSDVLGTWKRYEPKALHDEVMVCYGHGDGGGGPTRDMVQRGMALERGIPGAPKLRMEGLRPYLDRLGQKMDARADDFPIWNGELYLQYHRGTLTSVAKNKANNRKAELAMRGLEFVASMAMALNGVKYPRDTIRDLWDVVLINQFHDILPGTSIAEVYDDTDIEYGALFDDMQSKQGAFHTSLAKATAIKGDQCALLNITAQTRDHELVALDTDADLAGLAVQTAQGSSPIQVLVGADDQHVFAAPICDLPPLGWTTAQIVPATTKAETDLRVSETSLENSLIAVTFEDGEISSVIDKTSGREMIQTGKRANQMIAYEDKPKAYDAWDIDHYFEEKFWHLSDNPANVTVVETGPHRAAIRIERDYAKSSVVQIVSLQSGQKQLTFDTRVDWQERQTLLKTAFPLDLNTSETRAEIQFGHVKRASHKNTSWDQARFETSMQRWIDMSEPDCGVAFLNDCKYGYDAVEQTIRLTLLKGPIVPDPRADLGVHRFRYALMLHEGEKDLSTVIRAAERFNTPIMPHGKITTAATDRPPQSFSFAYLNADNVTLETVKGAEKGESIILRLFEHENRRGKAKLSFCLPISAVQNTDLMEGLQGEPLDIVDNAVTLEFRPFEIKTLRVTFESRDR